MKKAAALLLMAVMTLSLVGCDSDASVKSETAASAAQNSTTASEDTHAQEDDAIIRIAGLKGPTSIGLVKLMEDDSNKTSGNDYEFTICGSADEITPKLVKGELDLAAVPANLASVLYNKTGGQIKVLANNTHGVLYIVEAGDDISSLADLKDCTIYATGKGSTPEYSLEILLKQSGIDPDKDVNIEFKSEPTEVVQLLAANQGSIAMLPQPYVIAAMGSVEGLNIRINLSAEWDEMFPASHMITGVLIGRSEFIESHPEAIQTFLDEYADSVDYVNANPADAAQLVEKFDIAKAAIAEKAIPYCNVVCETGAEMKDSLTDYLEKLHELAPESVGGGLPKDDFYYQE